MEAINDFHRLNQFADGCGIRLILTDNDADRDCIGWHYRGGDSDGVERAIESAAHSGHDTVWVHYADQPETCPIMG